MNIGQVIAVIGFMLMAMGLMAAGVWMGMHAQAGWGWVLFLGFVVLFLIGCVCFPDKT